MVRGEFTPSHGTADTRGPMKACPHCDQEVAADAKLCPNCGTEMPGARAPSGAGGSAALGFTLGVLLFPVFVPVAFAALSAAPFRSIAGPMFIAPMVVGGLSLGVYFGTRNRFPVFARGFGRAALGSFAVALGALTSCYVFLSAWDHQIRSGQ